MYQRASDSEFGRQGIVELGLVTYSNLTLDDKTHEVFFGNDRVIIENRQAALAVF